MYARVMHIQSKPGMLDAIVQLYQTAVIPALQRQDGFVSTHLFTDPAHDKGMSITVWANEAALQASAGQGSLNAQIQQVMPLLAAPPVAEQLRSHLSVAQVD